jgi:hypothetical protein
VVWGVRSDYEIGAFPERVNIHPRPLGARATTAWGTRARVAAADAGLARRNSLDWPLANTRPVSLAGASLPSRYPRPASPPQALPSRRDPVPCRRRCWSSNAHRRYASTSASFQSEGGALVGRFGAGTVAAASVWPEFVCAGARCSSLFRGTVFAARCCCTTWVSSCASRWRPDRLRGAYWPGAKKTSAPSVNARECTSWASCADAASGMHAHLREVEREPRLQRGACRPQRHTALPWRDPVVRPARRGRHWCADAGGN